MKNIIIMRYIYLILLLVSSSVKAYSQDSIPKQTRLHPQSIPGMTRQQFDVYRNNMTAFDKRINDAWNNATLDKNAKGAVIENIMKERRAWLQQHLTDDQRKKIAGSQRSNTAFSHHASERKRTEDRLNSRGFRVNFPKDSI